MTPRARSRRHQPRRPFAFRVTFAIAASALAPLATVDPAAATPPLTGPDVERSHRLYGQIVVALGRGETEQARAHAEELVSVERGSAQPDPLRLAEALFLSGGLFARIGALEEAERAFTEAHQLYAAEIGLRNPLSSLALGTLGWVYLRMGDLPRARLATQRATALLPPTDEATSLACAMVYGKDLTRKSAPAVRRAARDCAERAQELGPDNPDALNSLAWAIATEEAPPPEALARAERLARRALELVPKSVPTADTLGVILTLRGAAREAAETFDTILDGARGPLDVYSEHLPLILFHAALAREAAGDVIGAAELAGRVRETPSPGVDASQLERLDARLVSRLPGHHGVLRDR